jgi:WD40 repeat protein
MTRHSHVRKVVSDILHGARCLKRNKSFPTLLAFLGRFYIICFAVLPAIAMFSSQLEIAQADCVHFSPISVNLESIGVENADFITELAQLTHREFTDFIVTPTGGTLITLTPTYAQIYRLDENSTEMAFLSDCRPVDKIALSFDGSLTAISERDSTQIQLWDSASNSLVKIIDASGNQITSLAFEATGTFFAWASSNVNEIAGDSVGNGSIVVYHLQSEMYTTTINDVAPIVTDIHIYADEEKIAFRGTYPGYGYDIQLWDMVNETRDGVLDFWLVLPAYSLDASKIALAVTLSLGITDEFAHRIEIWDIQTDTIIRSIEVPGNVQRERFSIPNRIPALALSSDARIVAAGNDEGIIELWNVSTGEMLASFQAHFDSVERLRFANDDKLLISMGLDHNTQSIRVWGIEH